MSVRQHLQQFAVLASQQHGNVLQSALCLHARDQGVSLRPHQEVG